MNRKSVVALGFLLTWAASPSLAGEKAPQKVVDFANAELSKLGADQMIIDTVKAKNSENTSLKAIKEKDEKWMSHAGIAPYMQELMDSPCGKHLKEFQNTHSYVAEMFLTDNQGANVAMTDKTSDYWQGDEAKFTKSFNGGNGVVFVGDVKFDDSSQAYLSQVSIPVKDGDKTIGVLVVGIDIDLLP